MTQTITQTDLTAALRRLIAESECAGMDQYQWESAVKALLDGRLTFDPNDRGECMMCSTTLLTGGWQGGSVFTLTYCSAACAISCI